MNPNIAIQPVWCPNWWCRTKRVYNWGQSMATPVKCAGCGCTYTGTVAVWIEVERVKSRDALALALKMEMRKQRNKATNLLEDAARAELYLGYYEAVFRAMQGKTTLQLLNQ